MEQDFDKMLREAIRQSGFTLYALWRDTGLHTASLVSFMDGRSLRSDKFAKLATHLGFELRKVKNVKPIKKGK